MEYTILILLLPLLSFLFLGLAGMKLKPAAAGLVGTAVLGVVTLLSCCTAFEYFTAGRDAAGAFPTLIPWNTVWLPISRTLHIDMGILLDPISVMMLVVISTVSLMVHVYSLGYMKGERGFQRYYAFLSLFTMSMMGLVVATNIFQMYLFWELVGVSSYLLIGFYYTKKEAVAASKKAFIVTRFADLGFLVGILFYGYYAGTFSFTPEVRLLAAAGTMIPLALGLLFIIPLADLFSRRRIVLVNFLLLAVSLLAIATASDIRVIHGFSLVTGVCSVIPQIFIPLAAQYSRPEYKNRNVGIVLSGLLTGILASRVVSGVVGELFGWREMYFAAAGLMVVSAAVVLYVLPDARPNFRGTYAALMKSLLTIVRRYPTLRLYSVRAALAFGSFLCFWASLAFKMAQAPFYAGSNVVGMLGLCGIAGALTATFAGKYIRRVGVRRFNYIGVGLQILAWLLFFFGADSYAALVAGIVVVDIGMQCIQLSNQTSIFELSPRASNRINTIFMTTYFIGGSTGTFLAGTSWQYFGWTGVIGTGILLTSCSLAINIFAKK